MNLRSNGYSTSPTPILTKRLAKDKTSHNAASQRPTSRTKRPAERKTSRSMASQRPTSRTERPAGDSTSSLSASPRPTKRMRRPAEISDSSDDDVTASAPEDGLKGPAGRPSLAQLGAPAAVPVKDRLSFLLSLSGNPEYLHFVEGIRDLKKEQTSERQEGWPTWATWSWERSHLPNDMHSSDDELLKFLQIVSSTKISGFMSSMRCPA
ncbi:hypothetical protein F4604DRAFT_1946220 [Suillus subluteus]|nr:hypothetical protein F4604DRAFT_1946220 [Suillus subluteus]